MVVRPPSVARRACRRETALERITMSHPNARPITSTDESPMGHVCSRLRIARPGCWLRAVTRPIATLAPLRATDRR
jgi:hypothetical protein